jgi:hypothetical protein
MKERAWHLPRNGDEFRSATPPVDPTPGTARNSLEYARRDGFPPQVGLEKRTGEPPEGSQQPCERPSR